MDASDCGRAVWAKLCGDYVLGKQAVCRMGPSYSGALSCIPTAYAIIWNAQEVADESSAP